jgi:flagellar motor switch protein FliN/FliY
MAEEQPPASNTSNEPAAVASEATNAAAVAAAPQTDDQSIDDTSIEELLKQASFEDPSAAGGAAAVAGTENFELPNFHQVMQDAQISSIDLLRDVDLNVKIELGRSHMLVEDVLKLAEGSVVELDKLAGDPVDVFVNDRLVARGEVLVLNDNFCVRINEIVAGVKEEGL